MQLFITDFQIQDKKIIIDDKRVLHQLKNVLRIKSQDRFFVQKQILDKVIRYEVNFDRIEKTVLYADILDSKEKDIKQEDFWIIISMLNKFPKLEMLVQKLSEIWIPNIIIRPSQRSVIKDVPSSKLDRLQKISLEAVEQSFWWSLPDIKFLKNKDFSIFLQDKEILVFDCDWENVKNSHLWKCEKMYAIIWPEWGLSEQDYELLHTKIQKRISLGENILRAETAGIISAWFLKNFK